MKKMIELTWRVNKTVPAGCPDYVPSPYTGEYPSHHCAVYHFESITEKKAKMFTTLKEAKDFADKAPQNCYDFIVDGKLVKENPPINDSITINTSGTLTITDGTSSVLWLG